MAEMFSIQSGVCVIYSTGVLFALTIAVATSGGWCYDVAQELKEPLSPQSPQYCRVAERLQ